MPCSQVLASSIEGPRPVVCLPWMMRCLWGLAASACTAGDGITAGTIVCDSTHGTPGGTTGSCTCTCGAGYSGADCATGGSAWLVNESCVRYCMHAPCRPSEHGCMEHASRRTHCTFTHHAQPPVAQSAPLYPAAHVHVHDPVVPPGVPCVESQTIVPAVLPSPAVHVLAADSKPSHCIIHAKHASVDMH